VFVDGGEGPGGADDALAGLGGCGQGDDDDELAVAGGGRAHDVLGAAGAQDAFDLVGAEVRGGLGGGGREAVAVGGQDVDPAEGAVALDGGDEAAAVGVVDVGAAEGSGEELGGAEAGADELVLGLAAHEACDGDTDEDDHGQEDAEERGQDLPAEATTAVAAAARVVEDAVHGGAGVTAVGGRGHETA